MMNFGCLVECLKHDSGLPNKLAQEARTILSELESIAEDDIEHFKAIVAEKIYPLVNKRAFIGITKGKTYFDRQTKTMIMRLIRICTMFEAEKKLYKLLHFNNSTVPTEQEISHSVEIVGNVTTQLLYLAQDDNQYLTTALSHVNIFIYTLVLVAVSSKYISDSKYNLVNLFAAVIACQLFNHGLFKALYNSLKYIFEKEQYNTLWRSLFKPVESQNGIDNSPGLISVYSHLQDMFVLEISSPEVSNSVPEMIQLLFPFDLNKPMVSLPDCLMYIEELGKQAKSGLKKDSKLVKLLSELYIITEFYDDARQLYMSSFFAYANMEPSILEIFDINGEWKMVISETPMIQQCLFRLCHFYANHQTLIDPQEFSKDAIWKFYSALSSHGQKLGQIYKSTNLQFTVILAFIDHFNEIAYSKPEDSTSVKELNLQVSTNLIDLLHFSLNQVNSKMKADGSIDTINQLHLNFRNCSSKHSLPTLFAHLVYTISDYLCNTLGDTNGFPEPIVKAMEFGSVSAAPKSNFIYPAPDEASKQDDSITTIYRKALQSLAMALNIFHKLIASSRSIFSDNNIRILFAPCFAAYYISTRCMLLSSLEPTSFPYLQSFGYFCSKLIFKILEILVFQGTEPEIAFHSLVVFISENSWHRLDFIENFIKIVSYLIFECNHSQQAKEIVKKNDLLFTSIVSYVSLWGPSNTKLVVQLSLFLQQVAREANEDKIASQLQSIVSSPALESELNLSLTEMAPFLNILENEQHYFEQRKSHMSDQSFKNSSIKTSTASMATSLMSAELLNDPKILQRTSAMVKLANVNPTLQPFDTTIEQPNYAYLSTSKYDSGSSGYTRRKAIVDINEVRNNWGTAT